MRNLNKITKDRGKYYGNIITYQNYMMCVPSTKHMGWINWVRAEVVMLDEVFSSKMIPVNDAARYTGTASENASGLNVERKKIDKHKCVVVTIT